MEPWDSRDENSKARLLVRVAPERDTVHPASTSKIDALPRPHRSAGPMGASTRPASDRHRPPRGASATKWAVPRPTGLREVPLLYRERRGATCVLTWSDACCPSRNDESIRALARGLLGHVRCHQPGRRRYAFGRSVHYAIWLRLVPDEDRERSMPRTFRASWRALAVDLGPWLAITAIVAVTAVGSWALFDVRAARAGYLRGVAFHGHLELVVLAFALVRGRMRP